MLTPIASMSNTLCVIQAVDDLTFRSQGNVGSVNLACQCDMEEVKTLSMQNCYGTILRA